MLVKIGSTNYSRTEQESTSLPSGTIVSHRHRSRPAKTCHVHYICYDGADSYGAEGSNLSYETNRDIFSSARR